MVSPILNQLASEYAGRVKIAKLNVDENPLTASQYAIRSIPTMLFFKDGKFVKSLVGALPKGEIEGHLRSILQLWIIFHIDFGYKRNRAGGTFRVFDNFS